jgi:tetratricopeptide (TPR) repeat protein
VKREWLEAHAQLLSVPPIFDHSTARTLASRFADTLADGAGRHAEEALYALRVAGLLVGEPDSWRLAEPYRSVKRRELAERDAGTFRGVVCLFVELARHRYQAHFHRRLGPHGAEVNLAVLELVGEPVDSDRRDSFDQLVHVIEEHRRVGRSVDTTGAARLLAATPPHLGSFGREVDFLDGLALWRRSRRGEAVTRFERVLDTPAGDRAEGIAAHLVGVYQHANGRSYLAVPLLDRAVVVLRDRNDLHGLTLTLTSLGRVLRDQAEQRPYQDPTTDPAWGPEHGEPTPAEDGGRADGDAESGVRTAVDVLKEACEVGERAGAPAVLGAALIELASAYELSGSAELAIGAARRAVGLLNQPSERAIWARTVLGGLYRDVGMHGEAVTVLDEGARLADEVPGGANFELAKLLNVLASSERRAGEVQTAIAHAERSVEIGRQLGHHRHLSRALHTLAVVLIDAALASGDAGDERWVRAVKALDESEAQLGKLGDRAGLAKVDRTRQRLRTHWDPKAGDGNAG